MLYGTCVYKYCVVDLIIGYDNERANTTVLLNENGKINALVLFFFMLQLRPYNSTSGAGFVCQILIIFNS